VALLTVISTVILYSLDNYYSYIDNHQRLAERSVLSTSREIEYFINERNRYLSLFADQEKSLLSGLIQDPHNESAHQELENKINVYFPNRFAFTVASLNGSPLLIQGKDLIGKACRKDIRKFSGSHEQNAIYVHQSPKTSRQHYDVMTSILKAPGAEYVLFVSFFLNDIFRIIEHGSIENHHLILIKRGAPSVIEASTPDSIELYEQHGHQFNLIPSVKPKEFRTVWPDSLDKLVSSAHEVEGTQWELLDVLDPGLLQRYKIRLALQATGVLSLFAMVTLAGFRLAKRIGTISGDTRSVLASVEKERRRIAMDLHDQVLSDISHLRRDCQQRMTDKENEGGVINSAAGMDGELEKITNAIRHIIDDLHPQSIELLGLGETIRSYNKKHFEQYQDMDANLAINNWEEKRLNKTEQLNIFRIFQEVIQNISKHASAAHCEITLEMTPQKLHLSIHDNGIGISDSSRQRNYGRGMTNIRARARIIHAKHGWESSSKGTLFSLEMPLTS
jgi:signal transduction histidine kinase